MKKALSILLLLTFLFNVGGYYFAYLVLRYTSYKEHSEKIDQNKYSKNDVREFKFPLSLPYPIHDEGYVRSYGEFEFEGEYYTLAEQKLVNDTLYIKGIKNDNKKKLNKVFTEYAKAANEVDPSSEKKMNSLLSKLGKEYKESSALLVISQFGWFRKIDFISFVPSLFQNYGEILSPPPNLPS